MTMSRVYSQNHIYDSDWDQDQLNDRDLLYGGITLMIQAL